MLCTKRTDGITLRTQTGGSLTDPKRSAEGLLLPIGGYKGSGLALMLGLLGGVLNGAAFGRDVIDFNYDQCGATNTGHLMVAIDIKRFIPLSTFMAEMDRHLAALRASKRLPGVDHIRLAATAVVLAASSASATACAAGGAPGPT